MMGEWVRCSEQLPEDGQRVLCWLPRNTVHLPGRSGETEERHVVILKFHRDFFLKNPSKTGKAVGAHFWTGEGTSNHFFPDVTHWRPLPGPPADHLP
ncbi:MAG: DUF551 domain-containing protein [Flavobacteriales bacterium]|nr:DUF551 domain-containing protein [Flavobacteriales bacterium]